MVGEHLNIVANVLGKAYKSMIYNLLSWLLLCIYPKVIMWLVSLFIYEYRTEHSEALVNVPDFKGWTPLHYACSENNLELIQRLLEVGADPNARYYSIQHP